MKKCPDCGASLDPDERCDCKWIATVRCPQCGTIQPEKFPPGQNHTYQCLSERCGFRWELNKEGKVTF